MPDFSDSVRFQHGTGATIRGSVGEYCFRLGSALIEDLLWKQGFSSQESVPTRLIDLLRMATSVFAIDRITKRDRRAGERGSSRTIEATVRLREPGFWNRSEVQDTLVEAVEFVGQDLWHVRFLPEEHSESRPRGQGLGFASDPPVVCLYSGGLDSAAGLVRRLRDRTGREFIAVMAMHQTLQGSRAEHQLRILKQHFDASLYPLIVRASLTLPRRMRDRKTGRATRPSRFRDQETSQRCRSFLYTVLGGVVAAVCGTPEVEVYETGIGAINLPLLHSVGPEPTRRCHPKFLELMSKLFGLVIERPIRFHLPFFSVTKAELVRGMAAQGLDELIRETFSCVHFPRGFKRIEQCGLCPSCILRRQALFSADLASADSQYEYDLFTERDVVNAIRGDRLMYLKAILAQVDDLSWTESDNEVPTYFAGHVVGTGITSAGRPPTSFIELYRRYRREWLDLLARVGERGYGWAGWLPNSTLVAS